MYVLMELSPILRGSFHPNIIWFMIESCKFNKNDLAALEMTDEIKIQGGLL